MSENEAKTQNSDTQSVTSNAPKQNYSKLDVLRQIIPSQRSCDSVLRKIDAIVDHDYEGVISEFKDLLENDKIVRKTYGTNENDDSWKKDPSELSYDELSKEVELLSKKLSYINNENKKLREEVDKLHNKEDEIDQENHVLLNNLVNSSTEQN